jgi:hypothetical protein
MKAGWEANNYSIFNILKYNRSPHLASEFILFLANHMKSFFKKQSGIFKFRKIIKTLVKLILVEKPQ